MGRTKPQSASADYVVGLTDGEGCFYVLVKNSLHYRAGAAVNLHFHIKMQAADRNVLESIKRTLKCGSVYFQHETRPNHTQCYRYTVAANRDIIGKIIPFFEKHSLLSSSKRKNFRIFKEIALLVKANKHLTIMGLKKIRSLKKQMNQRVGGLA